MNSWATNGNNWLYLLVPSVAATGASWLWLLVQSATPHRAGWISAVVIPLVLAGFSAVVLFPEMLRAVGAHETSSWNLVLIATAIAVGILFDQSSSLQRPRGELEGRRSPLPLMLWGGGVLSSMAAPAVSQLGSVSLVLEGWGSTAGRVGTLSLLGQALSWAWRLAGIKQSPNTKGNVAGSRDAPLPSARAHRCNVAGALAAVIAIWLAASPPESSAPPTGRSTMKSGPALIAFTLDGPQKGLYVATPDGAARRRLTDQSGTDPSWSLDSAAITFWDQQKYVEVRSNGEMRPISSRFAPGRSWSPDGKQFVFDEGSAFGGTINVFRANFDGSDIQALTGDGKSYSPVWSPDGRLIAFQRSGQSGFEVTIMSPDGSEIKSLGKGFSPSWSPDSALISFISGVPAHTELQIIGRDGRGLRTTLKRAHLEKVFWSGDPNYLLYTFSESAGKSTVKQFGVVKSDGTGARVLSIPKEICEEPQWSPTRLEILFQSTVQDDPWKTELWVTDIAGRRRQLTHTQEGRIGAASWSPLLDAVVLGKWMTASQAAIETTGSPTATSPAQSLAGRRDTESARTEITPPMPDAPLPPQEFASTAPREVYTPDAPRIGVSSGSAAAPVPTRPNSQVSKSRAVTILIGIAVVFSVLWLASGKRTHSKGTIPPA